MLSVLAMCAGRCVRDGVGGRGRGAKAEEGGCPRHRTAFFVLLSQSALGWPCVPLEIVWVVLAEGPLCTVLCVLFIWFFVCWDVVGVLISA